MSEQHASQEPPAETTPAETPAVEVAPLETTGEPAVDRVLEAMRDIESLPLPEQVAAYEKVQTELRGLLDGPRQPAPPAPGNS